MNGEFNLYKRLYFEKTLMTSLTLLLSWEIILLTAALVNNRML